MDQIISMKYLVIEYNIYFGTSGKVIDDNNGFFQVEIQKNSFKDWKKK